MRRFGIFIVLAALAGSALSAYAQDSKWAQREAACSREKVPAVQEVCLDRYLTRLDGNLNEVYADLSQKLSPAGFDDLKREQKRWLRQRNQCGRRFRCIETEYKERIAVLEKLVRTVSDRGGQQVSNAPPAFCPVERTLKSRNSDHSTLIVFRNTAESEEDSFKIYWLDGQGRRKLYATVFKGQTHRQQTFMTHPWVITSPQPGGGEICIGVYMPDAQERVIRLQ